MTTRIITFRQTQDEPEYKYLLSERPLNLGDFYYNRGNGRFCAVQRVLHPNQLNTPYPAIEATDNPKYETIYKKDI